jgi:hypothetical protein
VIRQVKVHEVLFITLSHSINLRTVGNFHKITLHRAKKIRIEDDVYFLREVSETGQSQ